MQLLRHLCSHYHHLYLYQFTGSILTFRATSLEWLFVKASNHHSIASDFPEGSQLHVHIPKPGRVLLRVIVARTRLYTLILSFRLLFRRSTYPELDHEGVHDAADHRDEIEGVPGVLEEVLFRGNSRKNWLAKWSLFAPIRYSILLPRSSLNSSDTFSISTDAD